jgi:hypothetical protein
VSSITDNGTGNYTVNFTTAMPDENYSAVCNGYQTGFVAQSNAQPVSLSSSSVQIWTGNTVNAALTDMLIVTVAVFR